MNNASQMRQTSRRVCLGRASVCLLLAALLVGVTTVRGQLLINVGDYDLAFNTAGQTIDIFVQNTGDTDIEVAGLSVSAQVADSGPPQGSEVGPIISNANITSGTQFSGNNTGNNFPQGQTPGQFFNVSTTTSSGTVSLLAGSVTKLVTLTLDTTGFTSPQTWGFFLGATIDGPTKYFDAGANDIVPTINDGTISVVPEPNVPLAVAGILGLFALWRRSRRPAVS